MRAYSAHHWSSCGRSSGEWFPQLYAPSHGGLSEAAGHQACTPHGTQPRQDAQGHPHHSGSPLGKQPQEC